MAMCFGLPTRIRTAGIRLRVAILPTKFHISKREYSYTFARESKSGGSAYHLIGRPPFLFVHLKKQDNIFLVSFLHLARERLIAVTLRNINVQWLKKLSQSYPMTSFSQSSSFKKYQGCLARPGNDVNKCLKHSGEWICALYKLHYYYYYLTDMRLNIQLKLINMVMDLNYNIGDIFRVLRYY